MIVWGGSNSGVAFNSGGRYNPSTDSWTATNTTNAPTARDFHMAVWTGSQMIVWGGIRRNQLFQHRRQILRGCTESDTHTNRNGDSHCNTHSDSNGDSDSYSNCDGDSTFNTDAYVNGVTKSYSHSEACTDAAAAPDSATATLALK
jgi:hypothetical protein